MVLFSSLLLTGCIPLVVGAGAGTGGVVAAEEKSAGSAVDDTKIKLAISSEFAQKDVSDLFRNVVVKVSEGRVQLTGDVDKPESKVEATRLAWQADGVKEVMNEIQVNDSTGIMDYAQDSWIANQIRTRLLLEKDLHSVNYSVEVVNGVVYLMGIAQNADELSKAQYIAGTTPHVTKVVSNVILKNDSRRK